MEKKKKKKKKIRRQLPGKTAAATSSGKRTAVAARENSGCREEQGGKQRRSGRNNGGDQRLWKSGTVAVTGGNGGFGITAVIHLSGGCGDDWAMVTGTTSAISGSTRPQSRVLPPEMKIKLPEMQTTNNNNSSTEDNECTVREQDRFMPIANVIRIMRKILPPHAKISDDAKETIQECVSEYISFVTGEANDRCQHEQRKTITAEDVLWAMNKLGFDDYIEPLTVYLHRYREFDGGERGSVRGEPLVKRNSDPGPFGGGMPPFVPAFHVGHHHNGFFSPASMGGFMKDPSTAGPSGSAAAMATFEPYEQCKE